MRKHIEWFNQVLTVAIQLYFRQGRKVDCIEKDRIPANGWMEQVTGKAKP